MKALNLALAFALVAGVCAFPSWLFGGAAGLPLHPVLQPVPQGANESAHWRKNLGAFGEQFSEELLKLRGYEVREMKRRGDSGIDRIGVKLDVLGEITDDGLKFVETKTGRTARLNITSHGKQGSPRWVARNFKDTPHAPEYERYLQSQARKKGFTVDRVLEECTELHHIDLTRERITVSRPCSGEVLWEDHPRRLMERIRKGTASQETRVWATKHMARWGQITKASHKEFVHKFAKTTISRALPRGLALSCGKAAARAVPVIGTVVAGAMDAAELAQLWAAYDAGELSQSAFVVRLSGFAGGLVGAGAGSWLGFQSGFWLGTLIFPGVGTIIGGFVGSIVGGGAGYILGRFAGEEAATAYFTHVDDHIRTLIERELLGAD